MLIPDDYDSIEYYPYFLGISIPEAMYLEDDSLLTEFHLTDITCSYREILACDSTGTVYHCYLNENQTLRPYNPHL